MSEAEKVAGKRSAKAADHWLSTQGVLGREPEKSIKNNGLGFWRILGTGLALKGLDKQHGVFQTHV